MRCFLALAVVGDSKGAATALKPAPVAGLASTTALSQGWALRSATGLTDSGATISRVGYTPSGWYPVTLPSTVLAGLVANNVYQNIYLGKNLTSIPRPDDAELVVPRRVHGASHRAGSSVLAPFQGNQLPRADLVERNSARRECGRHDGCTLVQRDEPDQRRWLERPCNPRHPAGPRVQGPLRLHGRLEPGGTRHGTQGSGVRRAWIRPGLSRSPIPT